MSSSEQETHQHSLENGPRAEHERRELREVSALRFREVLERDGFWMAEARFLKAIGYKSDRVPEQLAGVAAKYEAWDRKFPLVKGSVSYGEAQAFIDEFASLANEASTLLAEQQGEWETQESNAASDKERNESRKALEEIVREQELVTLSLRVLRERKADILADAFSATDDAKESLSALSQVQEQSPPEESVDEATEKFMSNIVTTIMRQPIEAANEGGGSRSEVLAPVSSRAAAESEKARGDISGSDDHAEETPKETAPSDRVLDEQRLAPEKKTESALLRMEQELRRVEIAIEAGEIEVGRGNLFFEQAKEMARALDPTNRRNFLGNSAVQKEFEDAKHRLEDAHERKAFLEAKIAEEKLLAEKAQAAVETVVETMTKEGKKSEEAALDRDTVKLNIDALDDRIGVLRRQFSELPAVFQQWDQRDAHPEAMRIREALTAAQAEKQTLQKQLEEIEKPHPEPVKQEADPKAVLSKEAAKEALTDKDKVLAKKFQEKFGLSWEDLQGIEGFEGLSDGRRYLLLENLTQLTLGRVQEEAALASEAARAAKQPVLSKLWKVFSRQYRVENFEKVKEEEMRTGGMAVHGAVLKHLVEMAGKGPGAHFNAETGQLEIDFLAQEGLSEAEAHIVGRFNQAALNFSKIPYTWSFEDADPKDRKQYEEAKQQYDTVRDLALHTFIAEQMRQGKFDRTNEAEPVLLQQFNDIDRNVEMQRFFTHHPQAEEVLLSLNSTAAWRRAWTGTIKENGLYLGAGFAGRTVASSLAVAGSAVAVPVAAGGFGFWRSWKRSGEQMKRQDVLMRERGTRGKKGLEKNFVDSRVEVAKIERLLDRLTEAEANDASTPEQQEKLRAMIATRIQYVNRKTEEGLMSFGGGLEGSVGTTETSLPVRIANQYHLVQTMARAEQWAKAGSDERRQKVERWLEKSLAGKKEEIAKTRKKYRIKSAATAALMGAGFAAAGAELHKFWKSEFFDDVKESVGETWKQSVETVMKGHTPAPGSRVLDEALPLTAPQGGGKTEAILNEALGNRPRTGMVDKGDAFLEAAQRTVEVKRGSGSSIEHELIDRYLENGVTKDRTEAGKMAHRAVLEWVKQHAGEEGVTAKQLEKSLDRIYSAKMTIDEQGHIVDLEFDPLKPLHHSQNIHVPRAQGLEEVIPQESTPVPKALSPEVVSSSLPKTEDVLAPEARFNTPSSPQTEAFEEIVKEADPYGENSLRKALPLVVDELAGGHDQSISFFRAIDKYPASMLNGRDIVKPSELSSDQWEKLLQFRKLAEATLGEKGVPQSSERFPLSIGVYIAQVTREIILKRKEDMFQELMP